MLSVSSLQFDEGGPLTYIKDGQAILIGDYSWSEGCAVVSLNQTIDI